MARLPYVDLSQVSEDVREVLSNVPPLRIFHLMAHAETNLRPLLRLGTSILTEQKFEGKLRELTILAVAKFSPAEYEWVQHVAIGKVFGVTDQQIEALHAGDLSGGCFSDRERLVLRFTSELVRDVRPSAGTFAELAAAFSPQEIVELILTIGYYMMLARLMETAEIDLDPPAGVEVIQAARR